MPSHASKEVLAYRNNIYIKIKKSYILIAKSLDSYIKYISFISIYIHP